MIRRPPRSTLFSLHDALPIYLQAPSSRETSNPKLQHPPRVDWRLKFGASLELVAWNLELPPCLHSTVCYTESVLDRKSTRLNSSHTVISYAVFCFKKKTHPFI